MAINSFIIIILFSPKVVFLILFGYFFGAKYFPVRIIVFNH